MNADARMTGQIAEFERWKDDFHDQLHEAIVTGRSWRQWQWNDGALVSTRIDPFEQLKRDDSQDWG